ncbi:TPA: hypothetical protein ACGF0Y_000481 [Vibrio cholerae]
MKTPNQEISEVLMFNSGNKLTPELILGLQARLSHIVESAVRTAKQEQEVEKENA